MTVAEKRAEAERVAQGMFDRGIILGWLILAEPAEEAGPLVDRDPGDEDDA